jgi:hypothetical protein
VENKITCAICDRSVAIGAGYLVRMDVMADPEMPDLTGEGIESADLNATIAAVIEEAKNLTAEDLQDGVHRRFEFRLCAGCHRRFLANPLGLPRQIRIGKN